jgi:transcriptional regulator with PAS, ATPase and Fis domain
VKLEKIMRPLGSDPPAGPGLSKNLEVYHLAPAQVEPCGPWVPVLNRSGLAIGTVKKELLTLILSLGVDELLGAITDQWSEGVIAAEPEGRVFYANEMYSRIFQVPIGKILGRNLFDVEPKSALVKVLRTRRPLVQQRQYVETIDKYVSCRITPIFIRNKFRGAVSVFSDATELAALDKQVRHTEQVVTELQKRLRSLTEMGNMKIIGQAPAFLKILSKAAIAAQTTVPILIQGENGVGKEILASFIHQNSARAGRPLIAVNCASIPENLIESELFGYEEGSFTGARRGGQMGKFELAHLGTLFLDEIGDMSPAAQAKVLRAIEEREIQRLGGERNRSVDVRLIAATNQPLEEMIERKLFRQDLYYRINTVILQMPALRERREDIPLFANVFLRHFNEKYKKQVRFPSEALAFFYSHDWPGNVRELRNCIESGVIMAQSGFFEMPPFEQLRAGRPSPPFPADSSRPETEPPKRLKEILDRAEREALIKALAVCGGHRAEAQKLLGLGRRTFYRKLNQHGLVRGTRLNVSINSENSTG